jgi:hypothetical protein
VGEELIEPNLAAGVVVDAADDARGLGSGQEQQQQHYESSDGGDAATAIVEWESKLEEGVIDRDVLERLIARVPMVVFS